MTAPKGLSDFQWRVKMHTISAKFEGRSRAEYDAALEAVEQLVTCISAAPESVLVSKAFENMLAMLGKEIEKTVEALLASFAPNDERLRLRVIGPTPTIPVSFGDKVLTLDFSRHDLPE